MERRSTWGKARLPAMTAREHWGRYAMGMVTETLFILALTAAGFALAVLAMVIWG